MRIEAASDPGAGIPFSFKKTQGNVPLGKNVVVIGGGNATMDTARAAKRNSGVEKVSLVYRRTRQYMPADEEELDFAVEDGVEFRELLNQKLLENGQTYLHGHETRRCRCKRTADQP